MKNFLISVTLVFAVSVVFALVTQQNQNQSNTVQATKEALPSIETITKASSDGSVSFLFKSESLPDGKKHITVTVDTKIVYDVFESGDVTYQITDNSWSPDNKTFFIAKQYSGKTHHLVIRGDGSEFKNQSKVLDVESFWNPTSTQKIKTVTGWASNDLLVVKTTIQDGSEGPNYWFVVSSRGFMQLAN